jgi:hypothetical protein
MVVVGQLETGSRVVGGELRRAESGGRVAGRGGVGDEGGEWVIDRQAADARAARMM